jgi:hypothetical protein
MGDVCTLTIVSWQGVAPTPGVYCKTPNGKTAYEIISFKAARPGSKTFGRIRCRRLPPGEIPDGATVFCWRWSRR